MLKDFYNPPPLAALADEKHPIVSSLLKFECLAEGFGWHENPPPFFFTLDQELMNVKVVPQPIPPHLLQEFERPHQVLDAIASSMRAGKLPQAIIPTCTIGTGVMVEGWMLQTADAEEFERKYRRIADAREIHKHPQRQEVRLVHAVTIDGRSVSMTRVRDKDCKVAPAILDGAIAHSLYSLIQAMKGCYPD